MSSAAGWAALAGFANTLGGRLQADHELEQKQKLMQMQQDAEMKRQQFLEKYKSDLDEARAASKHEREAGDVVGAARNPETGAWEGRTRDGSMIQLGDTSEAYQANLEAQRKAKLGKDEISIDKDKTTIDVNKARIDKMRKEVENYDSMIGKRNQPKAEKEKKDPDDSFIRGQYNKSIHELQYPIDPQTGKPVTTAVKNFDRATADKSVRDTLSEAYGQEKVSKILGNSMKDEVAAGFDRASAVPASDQKSPTQPNAPSVGQLQAAANAALRAGKDPAAVEAHLLQKMKEYGYTQ